MRPSGLLVDYGGTLVEEIGADLRAGNEWLLSRASFRPSHVTLEQVLERASLVAREVAAIRDTAHIEIPWPTLTRLIHDFFGIRFDEPMAELELGFWKAAVQTRPVPGARTAMKQIHSLGIPIAVVSNSSFGEPVIRYELAKHGLTDHLEFIMVSAEYAVRKPGHLMFQTAAARLGVAPDEFWFIGDRTDADVAGAKRAGMTAVWFCPEPPSGPPARSADIVASSWDEIARRIQVADGG